VTSVKYPADRVIPSIFIIDRSEKPLERLPNIASVRIARMLLASTAASPIHQETAIYDTVIYDARELNTQRILAPSGTP